MRHNTPRNFNNNNFPKKNYLLRIFISSVVSIGLLTGYGEQQNPEYNFMNEGSKQLTHYVKTKNIFENIDDIKKFILPYDDPPTYWIDFGHPTIQDETDDDEFILV